MHYLSDWILAIKKFCFVYRFKKRVDQLSSVSSDSGVHFFPVEEEEEEDSKIQGHLISLLFI